MRARFRWFFTGRRMESPRAIGLAVDNEAAAYQATQYLISQGHKRIAHIAGRLAQPDSEARLQGYRRALADAGLEADPRLVAVGDFTEAGGVMAMTQLLESRAPSALCLLPMTRAPLAHGWRCIGAASACRKKYR